MCFQMCSKVAFLSTSVITFITCERFNGIMYKHVGSQVASRPEFLAAYLTDEWFLSRVLSGVNNQLFIRYPSPITRVTLKRSLVCVCH